MSGGERKKNELLHLWMLEPKLIILDEIDSGLDVDSIKVVCNNLKEYYKNHKVSILVITHGPQLLKLLSATHIHILNEGKIIATGDYNLALKVGKEGYKKYNKAYLVSENEKNE